MVGDGGDEGDEVAAAEELGKKQRGVGLGFRRIDPVQGRPQDACVTAAFPKDSATVAAHLDRPLIFPIDDDDAKRGCGGLSLRKGNGYWFVFAVDCGVRGGKCNRQIIGQ